MDVDGDGVLSMFELEYFYEEQCERMERTGIEPLPFQDLLCQMLDLVKPESPGGLFFTPPFTIVLSFIAIGKPLLPSDISTNRVFVLVFLQVR